MKPNPTKTNSWKLLRARDLMERNVRSVGPGASLAELSEVFDDEGVSGVPVVDGKRLVGIVTKTDLARAVAEVGDEGEIPRDEPLEGVEGEEPLETHPNIDGGPRVSGSARELMSTQIVTAGEDETASELAARMLENHVHRILILRRGAIAGVVSSFDLMRAVVEYESHLSHRGD